MDRSIPVSSKIVFKRINEKNRQIHLSKLENIKSTISRDTRHSFVQAKSNKKKSQIREDKLTEIERENRLLLEKLTNIMRSTSHGNGNEAGLRSLNRDLRKRELVKITIENQALLKRLQEQKPIYKRQTWDNDRRQQEIYLRNISEYPLNLTFLNNSAHEFVEERPRTFQAPRGNMTGISNLATKIDEKLSSTSRNAEYSKKPQLTKNFRNDKLDPMNHNTKQKIMLYQTRKKIGFNNYLIHIYYYQDTFNIIASNNERADLKALSIPRKEGVELIVRYKQNYEDIVNKMKFKGSHIILGDELAYSMTEKKEEVFTAPNEIVEIQEENDADYEEKNKIHATQLEEVKSKGNDQKNNSKPSTGKSQREHGVEETGEIKERSRHESSENTRTVEKQEKNYDKPKSGLSKPGEGKIKQEETEKSPKLHEDQEETKGGNKKMEEDYVESVEGEYRESLESGDFNSLKNKK